MAKKEQQNHIILPGVSNYEKLKSKRSKIHSFDPFRGSAYSKKVVDNIEADPADPRFVPEEIYAQMLLSQLYDQTWKRKGGVQSFFNLEPKRRRKRLQALSSYDMIDEVLTKITDEIIVDGTNSDYPVDIEIDTLMLEEANIKKELITKLSERASEIFRDVYDMCGFREHGTKASLWNQVYEFMCEGSKAYTIVFDDNEKPNKIIGIVEIDALDLEPFYKDGVKMWIHKKSIQTPGRNNEEKIILYDSQVILIDWSSYKANARFSYLEQLVRAFNNLRIIDETKIIWAVTNSMYRSVFNIPTSGLSRIKAAQTVATEMARYHDDINYDSDSGELTTNGSPNMKFHKEYWFADGDQGKPSVETVGGDGPDLNDAGMNEYFAKKYYRASRIPFSRFDSSGSDSWNLDASSQLREEITFGRMINRIRHLLSPIFLKPVIIQLALEFPEIMDDHTILHAIKLRYESYSIFEELMQQDVLREKIKFIEDMRDSLKQQDADGDDVPFFSMKFLIEKYMPEIDAEMLKQNKKYHAEEQKELFEYMKLKAEQKINIALMKKAKGLDDDYSILEPESESNF